MTWTSKTKSLDVATVTPHINLTAGVVDRPPTTTNVSVEPLRLFGACARCSHLHLIDPMLVTWESLAMQAQIERYVDDVSVDFGVLASADTMKDYVKSYFAGTVAAGLAYLAMINEGYIWSDHFENVGGGNSKVRRKPDFVFSGPAGVALMESKGTRSATLKDFDATVEDGYVGQVEPHLGFTVGGTLATHGFSIGAHMTSPAKAELLVHHTSVMAAASGAAMAAAPAPAVQRASYATAIGLALGTALGDQIRAPTVSPPRTRDLVRFDWGGHVWLTSFGQDYLWPWMWEGYERRRERLGHRLPFFAIEETVAHRVLDQLTSSRRELAQIEIPTFEFGQADVGPDGSTQAAYFPDGLAVFDNLPEKASLRPVTWKR